MKVSSGNQSVNNNEEFECVDFGFDRENVICAIVPQASVHNEDILFVEFRIGYHLNNSFVPILGVLSNDSLEDLRDFVG